MFKCDNNIEEIINRIYSDFFLTARMIRFEKNLNEDLQNFIGGLSDQLHNFPNLDFKINFFKDELEMYLKYVELELQNNLPFEIKVRYVKQLEHIKKKLFLL